MFLLTYVTFSCIIIIKLSSKFPACSEHNCPVYYKNVCPKAYLKDAAKTQKNAINRNKKERAAKTFSLIMKATIRTSRLFEQPDLA